MCFFAAKRKGFPVLRNQSKCTVSETVVIGPWISLVLKTAGSAILTGFQHLPANAVSKQPRDYSIFSCSVSSVFVFFIRKFIFLYPLHPSYRLIIQVQIIGTKFKVVILRWKIQTTSE